MVRRRKSVLALALALAAPLAATGGPGPETARAAVPRTAAAAPGYWLVGTDGGIFSYGSAAFQGSTGNLRLNQPIVGMAPTTSGAGYWMVASDGGVFSYGDARFFGSTGSLKLNKPIVGMAATPSGAGYWMVATDGGIFSFGDARFFGSTGNLKLNQPIVGMAATPTGRGYWMVASDGGIFSFGDAAFHGSTGAIKLNQPITAMAATPGGRGYWMAGVDGGVFSFGDAAFKGAGPERPVPGGGTRKVVGMVPTSTGAGYWQVAASGEVLAFGDAPALGAPAAVNKPIVGLAAVPQRGGSPVGPVAPGTPTGPYEVPGAPNFFANVPDPSWGTSPSEDPLEAGIEKAGKVLAIAEAGDKVFVAGEFAGVTAPGVSWNKATANPGLITRRPYLVALNRLTGELITSWDAQPDGPVLSLQVTPDGKKLYAGGRFRNIGGAPAGRVALLDVSTAKQDSGFRPPVASAAVKALALHGSTLWIGGDFTSLETSPPTPRPQLAALDAQSGALRAGFVPPVANDGCYKGHTGVLTLGCDGVVQDLAVTADGKTLYVAGDFADFGGRGHGGLLTLNAATGAKTTWQAVNDRPIFGISLWPGDGQSLYAAAGGTGGRVVFYEYKSSSRSTRPKWTQKVDGDAMDVAATNQRVYLGGHYNFVLGKVTQCGPDSCTGSAQNGDIPNRHLSAFDARTGAHDDTFTAQANTANGPYVVALGAGHLYVGGDFTDIDDKPVDLGGTEFKRPGFVKFPAVG